MPCALLIFAGIGVNRLARGTPNTHFVRIGEPLPSDNGSTPEASSKDIRRTNKAAFFLVSFSAALAEKVHKPFLKKYFAKIALIELYNFVEKDIK